MKVIYDVRENCKAIKQEILAGKTFYRTKWGLYGTEEWWNNLQEQNLIEDIGGIISKVYFSGHNDFPEFEVDAGIEKFHFERLGDISVYERGRRVEVQATKSKYILPTSGLEDHLIPLVITILD